MSRGLLDIAGWPIELVDRGFAALHAPPIARVLLWGALAGAAGMWLYRRCSPQQRIADLRRELGEVQAQMAAHEGNFADLWTLVKHQLALAITQLRLAAGPALLAGLPALLALPALSNRYDVAWPAAAVPVRVCVTPAAAMKLLTWQPANASISAEDCWIVAWPAATQTIRLHEGQRELLRLPMAAPSPLVHKAQNWNLLIGNPAGYLDSASAVETIRLDLPVIELIARGPIWLRGWAPWFFAGVLVVSLWLRRRWQLH